MKSIIKHIAFVSLSLLWSSSSMGFFYSIPDSNFRIVLQEIYPHIFNGDTLDTDQAKLITQPMNLQNRGIVDVSGIEFFTGITMLDLSDNNIEILPQNITQLVNLELLNVSRNSLVAITNLKSLTFLKHLYLSNNLLQSIPGIANLTSLEELIINDNKIQQVDGVSELYNLISLNAANNLITSLPLIDKLSKIKILQFQNNLISTIGGLGFALDFNELHLETNSLTFGELKKLVGHPKFGSISFGSQQHIGVERTINAYLNEPLLIDLGVEEKTQNVTFTWSLPKGKEVITTVNKLEIDPALVDHNGLFRCRIKSVIFPGLEILVRPVTVILKDRIECDTSLISLDLLQKNCRVGAEISIIPNSGFDFENYKVGLISNSKIVYFDSLNTSIDSLKNDGYSIQMSGLKDGCRSTFSLGELYKPCIDSNCFSTKDFKLKTGNNCEKGAWLTITSASVASFQFDVRNNYGEIFYSKNDSIVELKDTLYFIDIFDGQCSKDTLMIIPFSPCRACLSSKDIRIKEFQKDTCLFGNDLIIELAKGFEDYKVWRLLGNDSILVESNFVQNVKQQSVHLLIRNGECEFDTIYRSSFVMCAIDTNVVVDTCLSFDNIDYKVIDDCENGNTLVLELSAFTSFETDQMIFTLTTDNMNISEAEKFHYNNLKESKYNLKVEAGNCTADFIIKNKYTPCVASCFQDSSIHYTLKNKLCAGFDLEISKSTFLKEYDFRLTHDGFEDADVFVDGNIFHGLKKGNYILKVQDKGTCSAEFDISISYTNCEDQVLLLNGNGFLNEVFLPYVGTTKIFNSKGYLLMQVEAPTSWDGRDSNGEFVSMGDYYVVSDDGQTMVISVVR